MQFALLDNQLLTQGIESMLSRIDFRSWTVLLAACCLAAPPGCDNDRSADSSGRQAGDSVEALNETDRSIKVEAGSSKRDLTAIRACFDTYKKALLREDGMLAASCVDAKTLNHYEMLRSLALTGDAGVVHGLRVYDKLIVLRARLLIPLETLQEMSKEAMFAEGIDNSWTDKSRVELNELGEIKLEGASWTSPRIVSASRRV